MGVHLQTCCIFSNHLFITLLTINGLKQTNEKTRNRKGNFTTKLQIYKQINKLEFDFYKFRI